MKIEVLSEIAQLLGDMGDSIIKITDGLKHLIVTGGDGISFVLAKKTKGDLKDLSAISIQFAAKQNRKVIQSIDEYLETPNEYDWPIVQMHLSDVLLKGSKLLTDWNNERSDFVVEPSYARLIDTLNARVSILERIKSMDAPVAKDELEALKTVNERYKVLVVQFKNAIQELNTYIKYNA